MFYFSLSNFINNNSDENYRNNPVENSLITDLKQSLKRYDTPEWNIRDNSHLNRYVFKDYMQNLVWFRQKYKQGDFRFKTKPSPNRGHRYLYLQKDKNPSSSIKSNSFKASSNIENSNVANEHISSKFRLSLIFGCFLKNFVHHD